MGVLELNRNPKNYFAEVEQVAFSPSNAPPGIGFSPDKMLQGRLFSYPDTQRYRLGANYQQLAINRPINEVNSYQRDGLMRVEKNDGDNYEPNGFQGAIQNEDYKEPPLRISGNTDRYKSHKDNDDFTQPGNLYRMFTEEEKERISSIIANTMKDVSEEIVKLNLVHFNKCDADYGKRIAKKLNFRI